MHHFYQSDLKELFTVEISTVIKRIMFSVIPGGHASIIDKPDLYGPTMAAFILPQVLLLAMDSSHHGCDRSGLLGDAVIISVCLWLGLTTFYR